MEHDQKITADSQFLSLCGITASTEPTSRIWHYTHDLERFVSVTSRIQDYAMAFTPTGDVQALTARARVDAILIMSLALAKRKRLNSAAATPQQRRDAENRLETLFWGNEQVVSLRRPSLSLNSCGIRHAVLDDVLWYGDPGELEASLVVVRTEELRGDADAGMGDVRYLAVLAAIGISSLFHC